MTAATDALAASVQALTEAVRAAANDPADQIRLLSRLAQYEPTASTGTGTAGAARAAVQGAAAALCRRAALSSLALACEAYQPSSYNDAATVLQGVLPLFDAEIETAADAGDLPSSQALRTLRTAVVANLTTKGAALPSLVQVSFPAPMPALAIAYRLYRDASRCIDLIARNAPPHPCFMASPMEALSS